MKTLTLGILALAIAGTTHAQRIENRKDNQQARIANGVRSGELTASETARLGAREASLNRQIRRDRLDGGGLTPTERARIAREQNALSRSIARQKQDAQRRP